MPGKRRAVVVPDEAQTFTVTKADLYAAACVRPEPCEAHKQTVDKMITRLEKARENGD